MASKYMCSRASQAFYACGAVPDLCISVFQHNTVKIAPETLIRASLTALVSL